MKLSSGTRIDIKAHRTSSPHLPFVGSNLPLFTYNLPSIGPFIGRMLTPVPSLRPKPIPSHLNSHAGQQQGFTLMEVMVTLAIVGILATLAVPNWGEFVRNSRISSTTNNFIGAMNLARVEAIKRGVNVILCRSDSSTTAAPTCGGTANTWSEGWLIYALPGVANQRDYRDTAVLPDLLPDTLIAVGPPTENITILSNTNGNRWLAFNPDGSLDETGEATYQVCGKAGSTGRGITVSLVGRPNVSNYSLSCSY
ncbi:MAG: prepilin-type N-terminal cleavage/methylation domain-containing protein [Gammaproteobacteria bacterium]|nr:prepilin-type N-terminal cleavage/methylation domain-containing protein [Gammaproteobacteria bacterium]